MGTSQEPTTSAFAITPIRSRVDIENVLRVFDDFFVPRLSVQVGNLATYAQTLAKFGSLLVARKSDTEEIAGFVAFYANDLVAREAYISLLAVSPAYRGFGLGSQLLVESCKEATKVNMRTIALQVRDDNLSALRLYEAQEFAKTRSIDGISHLRVKRLHNSSGGKP